MSRPAVSTSPPPEPQPPPGDVPGTPANKRRFRELPPWIQPWTAVIGVAIAAIGLGFTAIQIVGDRGPGPTPIVIKAEAFIEQVTVDNGEIEASGRFRNVDVLAEVILFVGRPAGESDARWLPVEARVTPQPSAAGVRTDGLWQAIRPFTEQGRFSWRALVVPATQGVNDGYEDIKAKGPESELVIAASEEWQTGE